MGSDSDFIQWLNFVLLITPAVQRPTAKINFREKLSFTIISLLVFLVMSQLPIYGVKSTKGDPFYHQRMILASNRGTVMELGIAPIITSGMIIQFLEGSDILKIPGKVRESKVMMNGINKLAAIALAFIQATVFVYSGMYGPIGALGIGNAILIIMQLFFASLIIILLDEMMELGYGIGSGISLFMCSNICADMVWKTLSPVTINNGTGTHFIGIIIAIPHLLLTRPNKIKSMYEIFFRGSGLPNVCNLLSAVVIWHLAAYFHEWKVELPLKSSRGDRESYRLKPLSIKLFYTSNMPVMLLSAFVGNIHFISQTLYSAYPKSLTVKLIGRWEPMYGNSDASVPVTGLAYLLCSPRSFQQCFSDPLQALFYIAFVLVASAFFAQLWVKLSNTGPDAMADQLKRQGVTIRGRRDTSQGMRDTAIEKVLSRYIPTAAILGGMLIGLITAFADITDALGSGPGIMIAVSTLNYYYETLKEEVGSKPKLSYLMALLGL